MTPAEERALRERFSGLAGPADGDWPDVERRAHRGVKTPMLAAVVSLALAVAGLAIGGKVIGAFDVKGKRVPLTALSPRDRELLVTSLCRHPALRVTPKGPAQVCRDGNPTIEEIANDGSEAHYRIRYPWGVTCLASGPSGGRRTISSLGCNAGAPERKVVPTPKRPITVDVRSALSLGQSFLHLTRVSGLAGEGVEKVALVARDGSRLATKVRGHAYSFAKIPDRRWSSIIALDGSGNVVYREHLPGGRPLPAAPPGAKLRVSFPRPPKRPTGRPFQHASTEVVSADVYRNGIVAVRFASTSGDAYRRLARSSSNGVVISCGRVAFGADRWEELAGGSEARLLPEVRMRMDTVHGGMPSPPYDFCEIAGTYGRYWNDEEGTHEVVEVPFTAIGQRFLGERGTARDLAYLARNRDMWPIRRAIQHGARTPSAAELVRIFGPRLEPLARRNGSPLAGRVGIWTDGQLIVASERAPDGRLLYVTIDGVRIPSTNIRGLARTL
jgi:hypothetical protein